MKVIDIDKLVAWLEEQKKQEMEVEERAVKEKEYHMALIAKESQWTYKYIISMIKDSDYNKEVDFIAEVKTDEK